MLLELSELRKSYGNMNVIRGLNLSVREGEFVGVIGPNGAGKTTLFGLVAGNLRCDTGRVTLGGRDVTKLTAEERCREGVARTFQIPQPFQSLTVYENVLVAATFGASLDAHDAAALAAKCVSRCQLAGLGDQLACSLTLLQRKRLELARALATRPRLLLLDEVAGGLTDPEMAQLVALVQGLHREGITILWIEHLVHALVAVAQRLVVLTDGAVLADGPPQQVIASQLVRETYLGAELELESGGGVAHAAH